VSLGLRAQSVERIDADRATISKLRSKLIEEGLEASPSFHCFSSSGNVERAKISPFCLAFSSISESHDRDAVRISPVRSQDQ
jgi:hypothetical protein